MNFGFKTYFEPKNPNVVIRVFEQSNECSFGQSFGKVCGGMGETGKSVAKMLLSSFNGFSLINIRELFISPIFSSIEMSREY